MDPAKAVAAAITAAHSCAACGRDFQDTYLRDFAGVPVCVDCYRDLGLLTLGELPANPDEGLLGRLLSAKESDIPAGPRARYGTVERFASRIDPDGAEKLILSAARGGSATGMQEVLWIMLAADALLRSGGRNGRAPLEGREMSLLLNLAARVGMDIAWAAMLDVGVAKRAPDPHGEEWLYEDTVHAGGGSLEALAKEKEAFVRYMRGVKAKVDILAEDAGGKRDDVDIGLGILARTADEILAAFSVMDQPSKGKRGPAA